MRLVVDVYDAHGVKQGTVPFVRSAGVTRVLDGAGSINIEGFATDEHAQQMFVNKARVRVYVEDMQGILREIGRGIIDKRRFNESSGGFSINIDGPDDLEDLKRINTLFKRNYSQARTEDVISDLTGLVGWLASVEPSVADNLLEVRLDGASVLKAIQTIAKQQGFHLRLGLTPGVVEVGQFGADIGLRITNTNILHTEAYRNKGIAFVDNISLTEDTEDIVNRVYVFGAGQNIEASLTLQSSTRNSPYPIKSRYGPDNQTLYYYIEDEASIAKYGLIEKPLIFKEIAPLANNQASIQRAANMLYDAAAAWLQRNSQQVTSYSLGVKKCEMTVRAGDKVRIVYKGVVDKDGAPFTYQSIDDLFWVIKVNESVSAEGKSLRLDVSTIDQPENSAARAIIEAMEKIEVQGIKVQTSFSHTFYGPYIEAMDESHDVTVPLTITDATHTLERCRLMIKSRPFRATASAAEASGGTTATSTSTDTAHKHLVGFWGSDTPAGFTNRQYSAFRSDNSGLGVDLPTAAGVDLYTQSVNLPHTHDVTIPAHTHDLNYGIHDDDQYPGLITIRVNGQIVASDLGTTSLGIDQEFDITDILNLFSIQQTHEITISCEEGQGTVEVSFDVYEMIIPFKLG